MLPFRLETLKKHGCNHKYPVQLPFPEFQFELPRKPFFSSPLLSNPVFHCSPDIIESCIWASVCAASSCVGGAPSSGLTAGSWRELWLDASQTVGDLHLPARWLWCRATTHHSGHRKSSRTAAHRLWPSNTAEQSPSEQLICSGAKIQKHIMDNGSIASELGLIHISCKSCQILDKKTFKHYQFHLRHIM